jgi:signal transduction histidine kinase
VKLWPIAALVASVLLAGCVAVLVALAQPVGSNHAVELNDLRAAAVDSWPEITAETFGGAAPPLTVLDAAGEVQYSTAPSLTSELDAAGSNAHVLTLREGAEPVGTLLVANLGAAAWDERMRLIATIMLVSFAAAALVTGLAFARVQRRVLRPFARLRRFAELVAHGDLDQPLPMDRWNAFGAFTESFDLLRTELRSTREAKERDRERNREVLSQLGHDIRTPVSVIAASAELLELGEDDPKRRARLDTIRGRTEQVSRLVDELVQTSSDDLVALPVTVREHEGSELKQLLLASDAAGDLQPFEVPDCVVDYDDARLQQVIDNLLSNAAKFAGTELEVAATIETSADSARLLRIRLRDFGAGIPSDELASILGRGNRGSNSEGVPGSGLGLFTASHLL